MVDTPAARGARPAMGSARCCIGRSTGERSCMGARAGRTATGPARAGAGRAEITRFVAAIGTGIDLAEIRGVLEWAKVRAGRLEAEPAGLAPLPAEGLDRGALEARVRERQELLRGAPQRARQILCKLLPDRLPLDRTPDGYRF